MLDYFFLFIAGFFGGFLAGLLGIGGGIVYITILPVIFAQYGLPDEQLVQFVVANSIFGTLFAALSGNITQLNEKNFFLREVLLVGLTAVISSLATLKFVVHTPWYSEEAFNVIVIFLLLFILFKTLKNVKLTRLVQDSKESVFKLLLTGVAGGTIAALSGLGGGAIMVPLLNLGLKMDIKKAKSISLGVIFISAFCMTVFNMLEDASFLSQEKFPHVGFIIFSIALPLGVGVVIGSPYGVKIGNKLTSKRIAYLFSLFICIVILSKLYDLLF
jgi:uncharacterized protein